MLWDESGLLMAPLVRRSWSRRGHTPELLQKGRHREKVSVAAGLWLPPSQDRLGLWSRTLVNEYFDHERVAAALEAVARVLRNRVVVVWDGGTLHKGEAIRALCRVRPGRFRFELLPPYAPMLNPVEPLWSWLKFGRWSNFAPRDAEHLNSVLVPELAALKRNQGRLVNFFMASELPPPRKLLT
jgi:putative transposase